MLFIFINGEHNIDETHLIIVSAVLSCTWSLRAALRVRISCRENTSSPAASTEKSTPRHRRWHQCHWQRVNIKAFRLIPQIASSFFVSDFSSFIYFYKIFSFLISGFYVSYNRLFLDSFYITVLPFPFWSFQFHLKHFSSFSLCTRLNGQLTCQFSSANHLPRQEETFDSGTDQARL